MSELTRCNYCTLRGLRARAKRDKKKVILRASCHGGINVRYMEQISWILDCGGDLAGYRKRYTERADEIFAADVAELEQHRNQLPYPCNQKGTQEL